MIRYFVKSSRPSNREKQLKNEIDAIISQAEQSGDVSLLEKVKGFGVVNDVNGLETILNAIKNNSAPKQESTVNATVMTEAQEEYTGPEEEAIQFEPMIDIQKDSQFNEPVIEREDIAAQYINPNNGGGDMGGGGGGNGMGGDFGGGETDAPPQDNGGQKNGPMPDDDSELYGSGNGEGGNLKDMPSETKRKAIKKTSEIVAKVYANILPVIPKWIAKIPEAKVQRLSWADEIDVNMVLDLGDNTQCTVSEFIGDYNQNVDNTLTITPEMQAEFQECLKDVLEEKNVAMTPQQRLIATVVSHAFTMFGGALQLSFTMKKQMEAFKQYHEENKAKNGAPTQNKTTTTPPPASNNGQTNNTGANKNEEAKKDIEHVEETSEEISIDPNDVQD